MTDSEFQANSSSALDSTAQDLANTIAEFEQYRERLVSETMTTAQRAKMPKATVMAQLEPELAKIDSALQTLREQQAAL
jgi:prefoldin subunit 5